MGVTRGKGLLEGFLAGKRAEMADSLISASARNGRILDLGCGSIPVFLGSIRFREKHGLDKVHLSKEIELQGEKISMRHGDVEKIERLPYEDGFFDAVTMLAVFEHVDPPSLPNLLREIYRVLKPGGQYILTTPAAWTDTLLRISARMGLVSREEIEEHKDRYTHRKIGDLLATAGFDASRIRYGYFEVFMNLWASAVK